MTPAPAGVISVHEAYTVSEFRRRARIGQYAWRKLRAAGFPVIPIGKKLYVLGKDFLDYLEQHRNDATKLELAQVKRGIMSRNEMREL